MSSEMKTITIIAEPISIEITRGQRGGYGWSIKVHAADEITAIYKIESIDQVLRKKYGNGDDKSEPVLKNFTPSNI